jgi:hypothetical protein
MVNYEFFKEISVNQADLIKSFAVFYLIIFSNTVLGLFTCHQVNFIKKNKLVLVCIAFLLFYFLVTMASENGNIEFIPPIQKLIHTVFFFILFLVTTRLDFRVMVVVLALIFIIYFIEINKDYYLDLNKNVDNNNEKNIYEQHKKYWITLDYPYKIRLFPVETKDFVIINKIEYILYLFIYLLLILGFIAYTGEIKDTLVNRKNITWWDVFTDTEICNLKERRSFIHYLKVGVGVKP